MFTTLVKKFAHLPYKQELIALASIMAGLFLGVALFSYNAHDASWFYYSSSPQPLHNLCGYIGAQIAALFFYVFGSASVLISFLLLWSGYTLVMRGSLEAEIDRVMVASGLVLIGAMLCSLYRVDFFNVTVPGGLLGKHLLASLLFWCGRFGGVMLLHMMLFVGLIIVLRFSFMGVVQKIFHALCFICNRKRFLNPLARTLKTIVLYMIAPITWIMHTAKKIYDNSIIGDSEYSVDDFERTLIESADEVSAQDVIWQEHASTKKTPKMAPATSLVEKITTSKAAVRTEKPEIKQDDVAVTSADNKQYDVPKTTLFETASHGHQEAKITKEMEARAKTLEEKLERFGVYGTVVSIKRGPVVTLFEYQPNIDTKVSKILALEDDLSLALQAMSIRIMAPIPGKSVVGFEVANKQRQNVLFGPIIRSSAYTEFDRGLPLILGEDTAGNHVIIDLAKMPHLLIAGSTGSGKSVALNAMLISLLCKKTPDEMKLILIDPKRLEFAPYADIAHLVFPIITDAKRAVPALRWVVKEMETRYETMSKCGARTIFDYNALVGKHAVAQQSMPYIVVVIDELADLMMTASRDIEDVIARIAQMARAAGIHMMVATQRPSVDVITGLIKVNFPSRVSFRVTSKVDSRTILDCSGADKLLGRGDMLFLDAGASALKRAHGAYVSDREINDVVAHIRAQRAPNYLDLNEAIAISDAQNSGDVDDQIYTDILAYLQEIDEVSISLLQRRFRIGFNRSARIIEKLESQGRIMSSDGGKTRKVIK